MDIRATTDRILEPRTMYKATEMLESEFILNIKALGSWVVGLTQRGLQSHAANSLRFVSTLV